MDGMILETRSRVERVLRMGERGVILFSSASTSVAPGFTGAAALSEVAGEQKEFREHGELNMMKGRDDVPFLPAPTTWIRGIADEVNPLINAFCAKSVVVDADAAGSAGREDHHM